MSKRLILCTFTVLAATLMTLAASPAQILPVRGLFIPISSYDDDPFVEDSVVERISGFRFSRGEDGRHTLSSNLVSIEDDTVIYREDSNTGEYIPFAWNPWSPELRKANATGDFTFPNEERFPLHRVERDSDGKIVLKEGLQLWLPQDLHRGMTTAFEAANCARDAAEYWSGRELDWGKDGRLDIIAHAFIDFNAFYSPTARTLFFGVVPHRLPGRPEVKMFELASSWEIVAHETGHALHEAIKPNRDSAHRGFKTWGESFADQVAMWTSLRDSDRIVRLLAETNGNLNESNALTRIGEAFATLTGEGTGLRDAFHDKKVSDTSEEEHDRSEVFTGALYRLFLTVYDGLKHEHGAEQALRRAGQIMGTFLMRAADFTPENRMSLEDVAKAYLKVDKEYFDSRYNAFLVDEFMRRELFDADSLSEWLSHEAATPTLRLPRRHSNQGLANQEIANQKIEGFLQTNLDKLGIGPDFGLKLQSVTGDNRPRRATDGPAETIVRVQLTQGRGDVATPLENHGILVFRANGTLADYHAPLPSSDHVSPLAGEFSQRQAMAMIGLAKHFRLDTLGAPLSIVRRVDGRLTVEARVMRGEGLKVYMEVFSLDNPQGERREVMTPPVPPSKRIHIPDSLLK
jgi:hypothetical protein